jgi:hypothetical protein
MACLTCGHTMEGLCSGWFWCPRCGTVRYEAYPDEPHHTSPKLVERCQAFERTMIVVKDLDRWHSLGIAESIHTPEERPVNP